MAAAQTQFKWGQKSALKSQSSADSSSLQAEQEVTETLWSDSDLIKCYQTHISAPTQSCFNDRVAVRMLYM